MAAQTYLVGTQYTLLSTELNSMASTARVLGSAFTTGGDYLLAEFELVVSFASAPTVSTGFSLWLLRAPDGTNYEDGSTSVTPAGNVACTFPVRAATGTQRCPVRRISIPPGTWKPLLINDATGQTIASSGNTLKVTPITYQS